MEQLYQDYKDVAEFHMVYISEAHAEDDRFPVGYAKELGIKEHKNYKERCSVASRLVLDKKLTIPCLVDSMESGAEKSYSAWPDRIFLVRKDGVLGVAAKRGPWGFKPALTKATEWLAEYKKTGKEPALPEPGDEEPDFFELSMQMSQAYDAKDYTLALSLAEQMHKMMPEAPSVPYNIACMQALRGDKDQAYHWLEKAIALGYNDADHLVADKDFESIQDEDRFAKIVEKLRGSDK